MFVQAGFVSRNRSISQREFNFALRYNFAAVYFMLEQR